MILRIEAKKTAPDSEGWINNVKVEFQVTAEDFANDLGKDLYKVECLGFSFVTADIYEKVLSGYQEKETTLRNSKFTAIYTLTTETEFLKVSVSK